MPVYPGAYHLFTVDDPRFWEFRSRLSDAEFTIADLDEQEWDTFHAINTAA